MGYKAARVPGPLLLKLGLILALSLSYLATSASAVAVKTTLKVCVLDETGRSVEAQPTLFNAKEKLVKNGPCYRSAVALDTTSLYFVSVSTKELLYSFTPLVVQPSDAGKEISLELKLRPVAAPQNPSIEVCLQDTNESSIPIRNVLLGGQKASLLPNDNSRRDCQQLTSPPLSNYKLVLQTDPLNSKSSPDPFGGYIPGLLLVLTIGVMALTAFTALRTVRLPNLLASEKTLQSTVREVRDLTSITKGFQESMKKGGASEPPITNVTSPETKQVESGAAADAGQDVTQTGRARAAQDVNPISREPSSTGVRVDVKGEARRRYLALMQGESVSYFCLMPLGVSSASDMVEESAKVLREEKSGTYVALPSLDIQGEAWLFPFPNRHFTPESFSSLFPALTEQQYEKGEVEPLSVIAVQPSLWKVSG